MKIQPKCMATAIGSLPYADAEQALDLVFHTIPGAPIWPQLPKRGLREQMEIQYSEGLPRAVVDEAKQRIYFDTSGDPSEELAQFYEGYMRGEEEGDFSAAAISPEFSRGIYALEERLRANGGKLPLIKVQTTGPISFALTVVDEAKRAIYYNEEFVDVVIKGLAMKCRWQLQKFKPYAENLICFVDEPILSAFGSSTYVSVQREDVVAKLGEVIEAVRAEGAMPGVHCCGNTEWSILIDAGAEIVNFDAYEFGESVALYPEQMKRHLVENANALAWGIVPTNQAIRQETVANLVEKFERLTDNLAQRAGIDKGTVVQQAIITPSCGTGSMAPADAERVFETLGELSATLRQRYGF